MDMNQKALVNLLGAAVGNQKPERFDWEAIDWKAVYELAKLHAVHPLLFPILNRLDIKKAPEAELLAEWQRSTLISVSDQLQHVYQAGKVLDLFNEAGIPVIALKGLVLRDLYPQPELRTMSDADILIHEEDIPLAKDILLGIGYRQEGFSPKHISFSHANYPHIEVHWTVVDSDIFKNAAWFNEAAWDNAVSCTACSTSALMLSTEHQILHLCLHMARHIMSSGIGLRQLCDLVLLLEAKKLEINWTSLNEKIKSCGLQAFYTAILTVCIKLFGLELPESSLHKASDNLKHIDELIEDILSGGVFGKESTNLNLAKFLLRYTNEHKKPSSSKITLYLSLLFPPPQRLDKKFTYAKQYPVLTPIAWLHRLMVYIFFKKDFTLSEKKMYLSTNTLHSALDRRTKLLEWLKLQ
jgi:hypothetical protein